MKCPYCSHNESKVLDSRESDKGESIRRRRECEFCHKRFTTYETFETIPIIVKKKDGSNQNFDKNKLLNGMIKACEKRAVPVSRITDAADEIEQALLNLQDKEITSTQLGEMAMEKLRSIDEVAYVRFASVYKQFRDISSFAEELNKLLREK